MVRRTGKDQRFSICAKGESARLSTLPFRRSVLLSLLEGMRMRAASAAIGSMALPYPKEKTSASRSPFQINTLTTPYCGCRPPLSDRCMRDRQQGPRPSQPGGHKKSKALASLAFYSSRPNPSSRAFRPIGLSNSLYEPGGSSLTARQRGLPPKTQTAMPLAEPCLFAGSFLWSGTLPKGGTLVINLCRASTFFLRQYD